MADPGCVFYVGGECSYAVDGGAWAVEIDGPELPSRRSDV